MRLLLLPLAIFFYALYFPIALIGSLIGIVFAPAIAGKVDSKGNLPWYLKWFETVDSTMFDAQWVYTHLTWSEWMIAKTWEQRNPFYGGCYSLLGN